VPGRRERKKNPPFRTRIRERHPKLTSSEGKKGGEGALFVCHEGRRKLVGVEEKRRGGDRPFHSYQKKKRKKRLIC